MTKSTDPAVAGLIARFADYEALQDSQDKLSEARAALQSVPGYTSPSAFKSAVLALIAERDDAKVDLNAEQAKTRRWFERHAFVSGEISKLTSSIESVQALHHVKRRYQVAGLEQLSFDSSEEAMACDDSPGDEPTFFEVCAECGRIEGAQAGEYSEEWSYRESLWPCKTARALGFTAETTEVCETCDGHGAVGSPPDAYMPCPDCSGEDLSDDRTDDREHETTKCGEGE